MLGYPPSKPSQIVFLAGVLLLIVGFVGYGYFQNPFLKSDSQICALLGAPVYFAGRMAMSSRRLKPITTNPKYATAFQVLAIILWLMVLPLVLFWAYVKIHQG